jgi:hypothetical protein
MAFTSIYKDLRRIKQGAFTRQHEKPNNFFEKHKR